MRRVGIDGRPKVVLPDGAHGVTKPRFDVVFDEIPTLTVASLRPRWAASSISWSLRMIVSFAIPMLDTDAVGGPSCREDPEFHVSCGTETQRRNRRLRRQRNLSGTETDHVKKGRVVAVDGQLTQHEFLGPDGRRQTRTAIRADRLQLLDVPSDEECD